MISFLTHNLSCSTSVSHSFLAFQETIIFIPTVNNKRFPPPPTQSPHTHTHITSSSTNGFIRVEVILDGVNQHTPQTHPTRVSLQLRSAQPSILLAHPPVP